MPFVTMSLKLQIKILIQRFLNNYPKCTEFSELELFFSRQYIANWKMIDNT